MNKIRVIDLLNKIANKEEVPKEIKYNACLFAFERQSEDYYSEEYGNLFEYLINEHRTGEFLNDEVEIIEENKLNRLDNRVAFLNLSNEEKLNYLYEMITRIIDKINSMEDK